MKKITFVEGKLGGLFSSKTCKNCHYWETDDGVHGKCWCYGGPMEDVHTSPNDTCFEYLKK